MAWALTYLTAREEAFVAQLVGLTQIPYGVALVLMQTVGYLQLSAAGGVPLAGPFVPVPPSPRSPL